MPEGLDACGGHVGIHGDGAYGYHYHTSDSFPNLPECLSGVQAVDNFTTTAEVGIGSVRRGLASSTRRNPPRGGPNPARLEQAAAELGISTERLQKALQNAGGRPPNLSVVAAELGVSEDQVRAALPPPRRRR